MAIAFLALTPSAARGQGPASPAHDPQDPLVRIVLLSEIGPLLVDLRVEIDGRPFRMHRERLLDETLALADSNGDGKPTWREAVSQARFVGGRFWSARDDEAERKLTLKLFDANSDGLVDREEARRVCGLQDGNRLFSLHAQHQGVLRADVFDALDADADGSLSVAELAQAESRLKACDRNDNDLVESTELPRATRRPLHGKLTGGPGQPIIPSAILLEPTLGSSPSRQRPNDSMPPADAHQEILRCYGEPLTTERFRSLGVLDANQDGRFGLNEADQLVRAPAAAAFAVRLGRVERKELRFQDCQAASLGDPAAKPQIGRIGDLTVVETPRLRIEAGLGPGSEADDPGQRAEQLLAQYDLDRNQYLERKEVKDIPQVEGQFALWDKNQDGKAERGEISTFVEGLQQAQLGLVHAAVAELDSPVFAVLDSDGDGRLTRREMQAAGARLRTYDANGDGRVARSEIPATITLTLGHGANYGMARPNSPPVRRSNDWFQAMDRNGDGDVTRREFLGSPAQFDAFDADRDGLLSREEARVGERR